MRALSIRTRRCSLLSCNLQLRRLPRAQAPDQIHDLLEAVSHKQAAGDGRAIAAGAMDDDERRAAPLAAQAKLLACDVAVDLTQQGQLLHGGWGYAEEYPISRYVVDAQVLPIFEGVKPILELKVIARSLFSG